jgi:hypothetical protein
LGNGCQVLGEVFDAIAGKIGRGIGQPRAAYIEGDHPTMAHQRVAHAVPHAAVVRITVHKHDRRTLAGDGVLGLGHAGMQADAAGADHVRGLQDAGRQALGRSG